MGMPVEGEMGDMQVVVVVVNMGEVAMALEEEEVKVHMEEEGEGTEAIEAIEKEEVCRWESGDVGRGCPTRGLEVEVAEEEGIEGEAGEEGTMMLGEEYGQTWQDPRELC